jgi:hypothetical protein
MAHFVAVKQHGSSKSTYLNLDRVNYMRQDGPDLAVVYFDGNETLAISENAATLAAASLNRGSGD